ncbi:MAG: hypothetical protein ABSB79_06880 [Syntrophales bacterium]
MAGRAAAFEKRLDGIVVFGGPFDMRDSAFEKIPKLGKWFYHHRWIRLFNILAHLKIKQDIMTRWGLSNGLWTIGGENPFDFFNGIAEYSLKLVANRILCDVLVISGQLDIYASPQQDALYQKSITHAKSFTYMRFKDEEGSAEHCQAGAVDQAMQVFFCWLIEKF